MNNKVISKNTKITLVDVEEFFEIDTPGVNVFFYNISSSKIKIEAKASCNIYFLANSISAVHDFEINITSKDVSVDVYAISLTRQEESLKTDISINHYAERTSCNYKFIGFAINSSFLAIKAKNKIFKGMKQSSTHQLLKILTDNSAKAIAEPGLMIDDFDVVASHGNSIGQIDQRAIYYLQSKGISRELARWMIIQGSITSILESVDKDVAFEYLNNLKTHLGVSNG